MKRGILVFSVFLIAVLVWLSITFWITDLATFILSSSGKCASDGSRDVLAECAPLLESLGATGDIFGVVTSLFSGLALFAVAFTLWADSNAKREARKPLVIADLNNESVVFDNPCPPPSSKLKMTIRPEISNSSSEVALNVSVQCEVRVDQLQTEAKTEQLRLPLSASKTEEVEFFIELEGSVLQSVLAALTEDSKCVELSVCTRYDSVEGVPWTTSSIYELRCRAGERKKLNAVRSGTDDFQDHWKNNAAVALDVNVRAGSWVHRKA